MGLPANLPASDPRTDQRASAKRLVGCSILVSVVALFGLWQGIEPFSSWFFVFAWWSYIFLLDGLTYLRRGHSMLFDRPRGFLYLVPWSVAFWLLFELANLRLANWYYVGLPINPMSRFAGIFVSFATVLPGIFETADFLSTFKFGEDRRCDPHFWRVSERRGRWMQILGLAFLLAPLAFPRQAFPLIWGATALLLEPRLAKSEAPSIWRHLAAGRPAVPLRLFAAGAICGLCWESWNFWASAKWMYTVPFFDELKLFEMPLLGFLGFPPFALECYTFGRFLVAEGLIPEWETDEPRRVLPRRRQLSYALACVGFCLPVILLVDHFVVRSTTTRLEDFNALRAENVNALRSAGIRDGRALQRALDRETAALDLDAKHLAALKTQLRISRTALMGARGAAWLASVGILSVDELGLRKPLSLTGELQVEGQGPKPMPSLAEVRNWIHAANR